MLTYSSTLRFGPRESLARTPNLAGGRLRAQVDDSALRSAQIGFDNAQSQMLRYQQLFDQKLMNETEFNQFKLAFDLKRQELETSKSNRELIKEGASKATGKVSNIVLSTVDGMVL